MKKKSESSIKCKCSCGKYFMAKFMFHEKGFGDVYDDTHCKECSKKADSEFWKEISRGVFKELMKCKIKSKTHYEINREFWGEDFRKEDKV